MSEALSCPSTETPTPGCDLKTLYWACVHTTLLNSKPGWTPGSPRRRPPKWTAMGGPHGRELPRLWFHCGSAQLLSFPGCEPAGQRRQHGPHAGRSGHVPLVSLLLNYFAGLDLEHRDQRGLTALMKAAMRDRSECVVALLMAGADLSSVDPVRGRTALEWAVLTDSFDTVRKIRQLLRRPRAEQLSLCYQPEWPALAQLVAQAQAQVQAAPSLLERLQATLSLAFAQSPQEGGVLDHFVTVTTSLASPFLSTACHTLCPDHPPTLGTRGKSVPELLGTAPPPPPAPHPPQAVPTSQAFVPSQSHQPMLSQWLPSRVSPRSQVPKILLSKAPSPTTQYDLILRPAGHRSLALPVWRYQERKKKEEEEAKKHGEAG
ncbi:photoreceptor ankyrin repeat protein isoform X3 [Psammomys obesus]|nr:photoreceptor ankyrin repeat protein isoform X3 [Psammomys obesus]XP_055483126.1 photoreceptor ankyrin repeat protein isoform X3 [Psammomys obesus]